MKKKLIAALSILFLCITQLIGVAAAAGSAPDLNRPISLSVEMKYSSTPLANVEITIFLVADMNAGSTWWNYALTSDFTGSQEDVSSISSAEVNLALSARLHNYAVSNALTGGTAKTNAYGRASFENIAPGLYLVVPGSADGYYDVDPYLVSVPGIVSGGDEWVYNVIAHPKTELQPEPTPDPPEIPETPTPTPSPTPEESPDPTDPADPVDPTDPADPVDPTDPADPVDPPDSPDEPPPIEIPEIPTTPPPPTVPGNTLIPDGDIFIEFGEDGVPLGEWRLGDDGVWIFEEYPPLADYSMELPQTGMLKWPVQAMAGSGVLLFSAGWVMLKGSKKDDAA